MSSASAARQCPNCGTDGVGRYCAACGERFLSPHDLEIRHFLIDHVPHELLHIDGKLARTLRLLFLKPGRLAVDYVEGRRQPFVSPLRLYLLLFVLHAFLAGLGKSSDITFAARVSQTDLFGLLSHLMAVRADVDWSDPVLGQELHEHGHWLSELANLMIFLFVAAFQKLMFYRLRRRYLEHVALALNVASFYLALIVCGDLASVPLHSHGFSDFGGHFQQIVGATALPLYWMLAIRRFYSCRIALALPSAVVMTAVTSAAAVALGTVVYAILIVTA